MILYPLSLMYLRNAVCSAGASELATVLVVQKKDDRNKKTSHLFLEISMNEAFIWLSGLCFIDNKKYQWLEFFPELSLKIIPHGGPEKI